MSVKCYIDGKLNEWQHCCVTQSSNNVKVYINGTLEDSMPTSTPGKMISGSGTLVLGQQQSEEGGGFNISNTFAGEIHQLNVFKRPLTDVEVWYMFQRGRCSDVDISLLPGEPQLNQFLLKFCFFAKLLSYVLTFSHHAFYF